MSEIDEEFDLDMRIFYILNENPGISYDTSRRMAIEEMKEENEE